ncbi:MAG: glycoside hydrolase [Chloroflexi bacterium]|nr:glycoside hydrolase [Chloroflexota bacterium]
MITKSKGSGPNTIRVTFEIPPYLWANTVHLVGDFNDWRLDAMPLEHLDDSGWQITLELERNQSYQYRYLLDGSDWANDSNADRYVHNPFGGENSVIDT